jgi:hypothetical protein
LVFWEKKSLESGVYFTQIAEGMSEGDGDG